MARAPGSSSGLVDPVDRARSDVRTCLGRVVSFDPRRSQGDVHDQAQVCRNGRAGGPCLASAGVIAAGGPLPDDPMPAMKPKASAAQVIREKPAAEKSVETVEIQGRVVTPDGRPVTGAAVTSLYVDTDALSIDASTHCRGPERSATSDGRFSIRLPRPKLDAVD